VLFALKRLKEISVALETGLKNGDQGIGNPSSSISNMIIAPMSTAICSPKKRTATLKGWVPKSKFPQVIIRFSEASDTLLERCTFPPYPSIGCLANSNSLSPSSFSL